MAIRRKIIEINESLCNGCGQCVPSCEEGAIRIVNGKARLVADRLCDGLGACLGTCPTGALKIVERNAAAFDEAAAAAVAVHGARAHGACPSATMQRFVEDDSPAASAAEPMSRLRQWPVQIHLVSPEAPYLHDADLLVAADCVPVAYAGFHEKLLKGRVVLMGCPKFDDVERYIDKFAAIFSAAPIRSVTIAVMQVPCCQAMPAIVMRGMERAGADVPVSAVTISLDGIVLRETPLH